MSAEHFKIPPPLSCKLNAHFSGLFPVLSTIGAVYFKLQLLDDWDIHNVFYVSEFKPSVSVLDASETPFCPEADNSCEFNVQNILDSCIVNPCGLVVE